MIENMRKAALVVMMCAVLPAAAGNLLDRSPSAWHTWSPRANIAPASRITGSGDDVALVMEADSFSRYGVWYTVVKGVKAGRYYRFSVLRRAERVAHPEMSAAAMLSWCRDDCTSDAIERDYIAEEPNGAEWRCHARTLRAPEGVAAVKIELILRWTDGGSVAWKGAVLTETDAPRPRLVRVATTHLRPSVPSTIAKNLDIMAAALDRAGAGKVDLICLSENVAGRGVDLPVPERAGRFTASHRDAVRQGQATPHVCADRLRGIRLRERL